MAVCPLCAETLPTTVALIQHVDVAHPPSPGAPLAARRLRQWTCERCTLDNADDSVACTACETPRAAAGAGEPALGTHPQPKLQRLAVAVAADSVVGRLETDLRAASAPGSWWALCAGSVELVLAEPADRSFSCGYRNIQMVLSSLRTHAGTWPPPLAGRLAVDGALPSILQLQTFLEAAWADGAPRARPGRRRGQRLL
jgi:hypothetical protein